MAAHYIPENRDTEGENHGLHKHPHESDIMPTKAREHLAHNERADNAALGVETLGEGVAFGRGGWRVNGGGWVQRRLAESGKWKVESGKWKVESGKWKVESGKWKVESGKWKVESGKLKVEN
jgi:hypothetical protein